MAQLLMWRLTPGNTCAGCHAHGVHPDSDKDTMNVSATPDSTTYAPGDYNYVQVPGDSKLMVWNCQPRERL